MIRTHNMPRQRLLSHMGLILLHHRGHSGYGESLTVSKNELLQERSHIHKDVLLIIISGRRMTRSWNRTHQLYIISKHVRLTERFVYLLSATKESVLEIIPLVWLNSSLFVLSRYSMLHHCLSGKRALRN